MAIITERIGDIFSAPPNSILIHACNARGSWAAGVALAFKKRYPAAYGVYHAHCTTIPPTSTSTTNPNTNTTTTKAKLAAHQSSLVGTTLLIPPSEVGGSGNGGESCWIACLFTSAGYGRSVSRPEIILENTRLAVDDLGRQVRVLQERRGRDQEGGDGEGDSGEGVPGECWAVRINSGLFGVPWAETKRVLEGGGVDVCVVRPWCEGEGEDGGEEKVESQRGEKGKVGVAIKGDGVEKEKRAEVKGGNKRTAPVHAELEERGKKRVLEDWLRGG